MDLLRTANEWLQRTRTAYAASLVAYQRAESSASFKASYGRAQYTSTDTDGLTVVHESWDFIINAEDLELDDVAVEPAVCDRIIVGELEDGRVYEVINIPGG